LAFENFGITKAIELTEQHCLD